MKRIWEIGSIILTGLVILLIVLIVVASAFIGL